MKVREFCCTIALFVLVVVSLGVLGGCSGKQPSSSSNEVASEDGKKRKKGDKGSKDSQKYDNENPESGKGMGGARSGEDGDDPPRAKGVTQSARIEPIEEQSLCIISADCPYGSHCDLGECIQDCNTELPCEDGLLCSPRARCVERGEFDRDPAPPTTRVGEVSIDPVATVLSEDDDRLLLRLTSTSREPVRYRVTTAAPHLIASQARGEFLEETVVELAVDSRNLVGRDVPGTVRVMTNLGELTVDAPIRVGLTGAYEGALRYSAGDTPLGQARISLDMLEENGDVQVRVHHDQSLLFPSRDGQDTYGRGLFTVSDGVDFRVSHVLSADAGGDRNRLQRPIGRELSMELYPAAPGVLEGTFKERIHGLFVQPVELSGTVSLRTRPKEIVKDFEVPERLEMPSVSATTSPARRFLGGASSRYIVADAVSDACVKMAQIPLQPLPDLGGWFACMEAADEFYYEKFADSLSASRVSAEPLSELRDSCEGEMALPYKDFVSLGSRRRCMHPFGPGAILYELEDSFSPSAASAARLFHVALARLLAGPLFVAQDDIVKGVWESFHSGADAQEKHLRKARSHLHAVGAIVLQPSLLEYMRRTSLSDAAGEPDSEDRTRAGYPGFRALSRLLYVSSVVDGELAALASVDTASSREERLLSAQEAAVLTLAEGAILHSIMQSWGSAPPGTGTELTGALTPMDSGFGTLLHGAALFGVPTGEVPLAFDPDRPQPTNFEQVLGFGAQSSLEQQADDEAAFISNLREFEQNRARLEAELASLRGGLEDTIVSICGPSFDPDSIESEEDWQRCSADREGLVALEMSNLELRHAEALAAHTRLEGMAQKISIDHKALKESQAARGKTLEFVDNTNSKINAIQRTSNILAGAVKALELASNASAMNGGASIAMGAAAGVIEHQRMELGVQQDMLRQAQQMRQLEETKEIEFINGMAAIQKQLIDQQQLAIELQQTAIAITQAEIGIVNQIDSAKRAVLERERALMRVSNSPYSDPLFRMLTSRSSLHALASRRMAQRWLYRAGRALEYEINTPLGESLDRAVLAAFNQKEIERLTNCYQSIHSEYVQQAGVPQEFSTTISVRKMLGVDGARYDDVTGEELSEGQLFRQILLRNENLDGKGGVGVEFSTNLQPGNELWSSNVCDDRVMSVRAQIVGDFQGDNEAEIRLITAGSGIMRRCDSDELISWSSEEEGTAIIQAGVNSFGEARENTTLYGNSVARPTWKVIVSGPDSAPANKDLDLSQIEDIVLRVKHEALPADKKSISVPVSCLSTIGAGN